MRILSLAALLLLTASLAAQQVQPALHIVTGLEIDAPQRRVRPGLVKISARVDAKENQKVKILWDVAARFDDASVELEWEKRSERTVQVVVPDSSGIIVVTAWALIDGEPSSDRPARTLIEVAYKQPETPQKAGKWEAPRPVPELGPRPEADPKQDVPTPQKAPSKEDAKKAPREAGSAKDKEQVKARVTTVYAVADLIDGEPNIVAAITGQSLKNLLRKQGVSYVLVGTETGTIEKLKLRQFIDDAGGAPCVIYAVGDRVRKAVKLTASITAEEIAKGAE